LGAGSRIGAWPAAVPVRAADAHVPRRRLASRGPRRRLVHQPRARHADPRVGLRDAPIRVVPPRARGRLARGRGLRVGAVLLQRSHVKMERLLEDYLNYGNHFVYWSQLAWSKWGFGLSVAGPGDTMSFTLGIVHLALALVALVLLARRRSPLLAPCAFFAAATL